ncbi:MAG TPA: xanthine dehydrogenase family protein subunit M [Phenylobacterium sp.]|uniref:FAD binding domain-containing protein n=1 Tax=Phenylobacterium sp. TaxID=1871053 RepID=UPI002C873B24|nr:xanthine dehydrogenase family protein subunit M [Phenylobacterium sp.]HSV04716.1 xanthine dehydrogenase family protein subunit M [Phenylobacterium sp.]
MRPFAYLRAHDPAEAVRAASGPGGPPTSAPSQFLAGGTTLIDLMKLDVMRPSQVVDINDLSDELGEIHADAAGLRLGALARMADAAVHPAVLRDYPVIAQSLELAASPQIRNMATLGGNVLQRTRCNYFRFTDFAECNKRVPGSGCAALHGVNRKLAVLGVSDRCIANYPGDFANVLAALGAEVGIAGPSGARRMAFEALHRLPGDSPDVETTLRPGELITGFFVPAGPWTRRSLYLKVRDRQSYEFALAAAAVALDLEGGVVRQARVGLGGVAAKPWRSREAEAVLTGRRLDEPAAAEAARAAFAQAVSHGENAYKIELGRRTLHRALLQAARMEV